MNIAEQLAENLLSVFEGGNWTEVSIADVLSDISYVEANAKTAASKNSIAGLVHHLMYWNGVILQRIQDHDLEIPEANGFDVEVLASEKDWQSLIAQTKHSFTELAKAIKLFPADRLNHPTNFGKSTFRKNLFGIVEHAYYHLGQIVMIKKLIRSRPIRNEKN
jgi:uncharacterized damage-inducible protein DinB